MAALGEDLGSLYHVALGFDVGSRTKFRTPKFLHQIQPVLYIELMQFTRVSGYTMNSISAVADRRIVHGMCCPQRTLNLSALPITSQQKAPLRNALRGTLHAA